MTESKLHCTECSSPQHFRHPLLLDYRLIEIHHRIRGINTFSHPQAAGWGNDRATCVVTLSNCSVAMDRHTSHHCYCTSVRRFPLTVSRSKLLLTVFLTTQSKVQGPTRVQNLQIKKHLAFCSQFIKRRFPSLCTGMATHSAGAAQDPSQSTGERGELVHALSKETPGSPEASELGSPRCTPNFDLLNIVVSYKRMALYLEPVADAVELSRFLLGCVYFCGLFEHPMI